jgi:ribosome maturation factor RimP
MDRQKFEEIASAAAQVRGCRIVETLFNDDDNIFELILDKDGGADLEDCESVHRAILAAFDRDVEDYSLTVGSAGISAEQADALLKSIKE